MIGHWLIHQFSMPAETALRISEGAMIADGATHFTEVGPGKVLQGLVQKVNKEMVTDGFS